MGLGDYRRGCCSGVDYGGSSGRRVKAMYVTTGRGMGETPAGSINWAGVVVGLVALGLVFMIAPRKAAR